MSPKSIELLTVKVGGDMKQVLSGLNRLGAKVDQVGKRMRRTGHVLNRNVTAPLAAVGAAAVASSVRIGNVADKLLDLEQQSGLSTDALQEFRHVSTVAGVEADTLAKAAQQMTLRLSRGAEGSADLRDGLSQLGISMKDAEGNIRPMNEIVSESVAALSGMEDTTKRNVLATKLFSRGASDLAPILGLGADKIQQTREEARELGLVLDRDALESANAFRVQWQTLAKVLEASVSRMGVAVIPVISKFASVLQSRLVPMVEGAVEWIGELDTETVVVAASIAGVAASIGPLVLAGGKLVGVLGAILSPAGLVVVGMTALAATAAVVVKNWDVLALQGTLAWTALKDAVFSAISGILGALERLPLVGDKIAELKEKFDEFAEDSLANANDRILELEGRLNSAGAEMARAGSGAESLSEEMEEAGRASNELVLPAVTAVSEGLLVSGQHAAVLREGIRITVPEVEALAGAGEEVVDKFRRLKDAIGDVALQGVDAFIDFASGAGDAIGRFVKRALSDLAKLAARMLFIRGIMQFLPGVGNFLGFDRFAGGFAHGGMIPAGQFGLVAEAGRPEVISRPSFVQGPAQVSASPGSGAPSVFHLTLVTETGQVITDRVSHGQRQGADTRRVERVPIAAMALGT